MLAVTLAEDFLTFCRIKVIFDLFVDAEWQPHLHRENLHRASEPARRDADHRERMTVDEYLRTEHSRIKIVFLPISVTDDRDRRIAFGCFFFRQECATSCERNAKHREII